MAKCSDTAEKRLRAEVDKRLLLVCELTHTQSVAVRPSYDVSSVGHCFSNFVLPHFDLDQTNQSSSVQQLKECWVRVRGSFPPRFSLQVSQIIVFLRH